MKYFCLKKSSGVKNVAIIFMLFVGQTLKTMREHRTDFITFVQESGRCTEPGGGNTRKSYTANKKNKKFVQQYCVANRTRMYISRTCSQCWHEVGRCLSCIQLSQKSIYNVVFTINKTTIQNSQMHHFSTKYLYFSTHLVQQCTSFCMPSQTNISGQVASHACIASFS
jgi:hypothetical protein